MSTDAGGPGPRSEVEQIKESSGYLRGTLRESLADPLTGGIAQADQALIKFHGTYQQDDRDARERRQERKLEPAYSFMVRIRVPGGMLRPEQWLQLDELAGRYGGDTLRLTTRQAVQLHGVLKRDLQALIRDVNALGLDTIAACGDVNRNVICSPNPESSPLHGRVYETAVAISAQLTPRTGAYREIWIDGEPVHATGGDEEPLYGRTYLPRKFKVALAIPPDNDVDVFAHDLGFIALADGAALTGFNVVVGGGMGQTHGVSTTYPQLGRVIGSCRPEEAVEVAEAVVTVQRDFGDRTDRRQARLKYTIDRQGLDWFTEELARRRGRPLDPAGPFHFTRTGDRYGWQPDGRGRWNLVLFIENGRVRDLPDRRLRTGLRALARVHQGDFRLTPNQNLMLGGVSAEAREAIQRLVDEHGLDSGTASAVRRHALACVALPTCPLAMAEAERYLPSLLDRVEALLRQTGLERETITLRMTGCPNGCARPYLAEIGLVGKGPGRYNLYLGAGFGGDRLNQLYRENVDEAEILAELERLLGQYAAERHPEEAFGDFVVRQGYVAAVHDGRQFHRVAAADRPAAEG
ncbi:MAG: assimilatory sulfite reductase (NADPH) hemoprotein subunit [Candidatus Latescibacterota bacterium]|jgi:sulfite reductase (NADPH) hemoprotein beta-component